MARDPLETVLRLRKRAVDDVRRELAAALAAESAAAAAARVADLSIEEEARRASDPAGGDDLVEAFAAWLPGARHRAALARSEQERLAADVDRHRAELAACRIGAEAIETLLAQRRATRLDEETRRTQRMMDEAAARTGPPPRMG